MNINFETGTATTTTDDNVQLYGVYINFGKKLILRTKDQQDQYQLHEAVKYTLQIMREKITHIELP